MSSNPILDEPFRPTVFRGKGGSGGGSTEQRYQEKPRSWKSAKKANAQRPPPKPKPHADDWDHEPHKNNEMFIPKSDPDVHVWSLSALLTWRTKFGGPVNHDWIVTHSERNEAASFLKPNKPAPENSTPSKDLSKDLEEMNGSLHGERPPASTLYPKYFENELPPHWPTLMDLSPVDPAELIQAQAQPSYNWTDLCRDDSFPISEEASAFQIDQIAASMIPGGVVNDNLPNTPSHHNLNQMPGYEGSYNSVHSYSTPRSGSRF